MEVSGQEINWRSAAFWQKLVSQTTNTSLLWSGSLPTFCIVNKKSQASVRDPVNALQNLTGAPAAGATGISMAARGPGQTLGGMGSLGAMGQPPSGTSRIAPHGMAVVSVATQQTQLQLQQFQQQPAALQQQQFQAQQSAMQQQFPAVVQEQPQQQHLIKLHHQNQQQIQQQLQRMAQLQLQHQRQQQQQQALQAPPVQQLQPPPAG